MRIKPSFIKYWVPSLLVILTLLLQFFFKNNPSITEKVYSTGLYPVIAISLSTISSIIPISLDDLFYVFLLTMFLWGMILCVFKKMKALKFILRTLQATGLVYVLFYWLWGFNYYREPAHQRLQLSKSTANDSTFVHMFHQVIAQTNNTYTPISAFKQETSDSILIASYQRMSSFICFDDPMPYQKIKHITFSDFFAKATILGYYGPFFNETHVNKNLTTWDIPVVSAHEMSHQLGVSSEAEAGFYGWLICVNSNDAFTTYSGWLYALDYFIYQSKDVNNRQELLNTIRLEVVNDIKQRNKHWRLWRNETIDKAATRVNDAYLKSNSIKKGIDDYNGVVHLIIDYLKQEE